VNVCRIMLLFFVCFPTRASRFITANNCNVDGAQTQILEHLVWRGTYDVEAVIDEDFSDIESRNELYWRAFDLQVRCRRLDKRSHYPIGHTFEDNTP